MALDEPGLGTSRGRGSLNAGRQTAFVERTGADEIANPHAHRDPSQPLQSEFQQHAGPVGSKSVGSKNVNGYSDAEPSRSNTTGAALKATRRTAIGLKATAARAYGAASRRTPILKQAGWRGLSRLGAASWRVAESTKLAKPLSLVGAAILAIHGWLSAVHNSWTSAVARSVVFRTLTNTIWKRIMFSNMIALGVVVIGLVLVSLDSRWVVNTRSEALRVQGQIIAAAIAGDLKVSSRRNIIDPDRPAVDAITRLPFRDDGFASLELSIRPERVAPILRRLIEPTDTRARVISSDFSVIVDSKEILSFDLEGEAGDVTDPGRPRWKDFWTRSLHLLIGKEVQVYRERDLSTARDYPEVVQAMRGDPKTLLFLNQAGEQIVNVAVPIKRQDQVLGVLLMSTLPGEVDTILSEASQGFWKLVLVAFLASVLSALFLARTVAKPIRKLSASAERVSKDINARKELAPDVGGGLEVAQMRTALQTMVASLYRRIENSEKFAADVAHELKNPLAAASSTAQCLTYAKTEEQRQELVDQIGEELRRLNRLITDVSRASRLEAELALQTTDHVDVTRVLQGVIDIFKDKPAAEHCTVALQLADADAGALFVGGNAGRLAQVMTNLIDNAVSFTSPGGTVCVGARRDATHVIIWVDDEGPGLEAGSQDTIFTRFYTHRPTEFSSRGNTSGLGLSISREIVTAHGGDIWAENREAAAGPMESTVASKPASSAALQAVKGARFTVRLPVRAVDLVNSAAE